LYESKSTLPTDPNTPDYTNLLLFINQEEGRIRFTAAAGPEPARFHYDYFLKDHLGNVRMVLTDEQAAPSIYQAGMETSARVFEEALFGEQVSATAVPKPGGFDTDNANAYVSRVNG